jgi:hypothetical protein
MTTNSRDTNIRRAIIKGLELLKTRPNRDFSQPKTTLKMRKPTVMGNSPNKPEIKYFPIRSKLNSFFKFIFLFL